MKGCPRRRSGQAGSLWTLVLALLAVGVGSGGCAGRRPVAPRGTGGTATVEFVEPGRYTDFLVSGPTGRSDTEAWEAELAASVREEAGRCLGPDREVQVRILDIDLGGILAPGPLGIRVAAAASPSVIELEYVLRDRAGTVVSAGRERLVESAESLPPGAEVTDLSVLRQALRDWLRKLGPL